MNTTDRQAYSYTQYMINKIRRQKFEKLLEKRKEKPKRQPPQTIPKQTRQNRRKRETEKSNVNVLGKPQLTQTFYSTEFRQ